MPRWLVILGALAITAPAHAGELPECTRTVEQQVKSANLVVVATAKSKTRRKHDDLRTSFAVQAVLKGKLTKKAITVEDCADWKCDGSTFKRGQKVILLLFQLDKHIELIGPACQQGFNNAWVDASGPDAQAVTDAASAP